MSGNYRGGFSTGSPARSAGRGRGYQMPKLQGSPSNYYLQNYPESYGGIAVVPGNVSYNQYHNAGQGSPQYGTRSNTRSSYGEQVQQSPNLPHYQAQDDSYNYQPQEKPPQRQKSSQNGERKLPTLQKRDSSGSEEEFDGTAYINSIIDEYYATEESSQVLRQAQIPYTEIKLKSRDGSSEDLNEYRNKAPCSISWRFQVYVTHFAKLRHVALLCNEYSSRNKFKLVDVRGTPLEPCRVASGECFNTHPGIYEVRIDFQCSHAGIYKQWVAFDITSQAPYLVRPVHVFVGDENDPAFQVEKFRFETTVAELEWNTATTDIVMSDWPSYDREPVARQLLARWKPLGAALENDSLALRTKWHGPDNYKRVMHASIRLEEAAVAGAIGRVFIDSPEMRIEQSPDGFHLDGLIMLGQALDPRTKMGSLTLKNASRMLLAFKDFVGVSETALPRVYEADIIEKKRGMTQQGRQVQTGSELFNTVVRLHLSKRCVDEQQLEAGQAVLLHQARFQISRLPFCEWHDAVERVFCWNILFPSIELHVPKLDVDMVKLDPRIVDEGLLRNEGQIEVLKSILAKPAAAEGMCTTLPPIVIQGAFGTGKTFALAQALKVLLYEACFDPHIRIVLCTISNSAADLYITEYLLPFLATLDKSGWKKTQMPRILRIYKSQRLASTVDPKVLRFCRLQPSRIWQGQFEFTTATTSDVMSAQLIISNLVGVMDIERLCLPKSTFSHIVLDEAAQSFEADALKALCLAGPQTRVVMAGDPRQMAGGTIHCPLLKRYGFDRALIERLTHYYMADEKFGDLGYGHVLQTNYRCHPGLMEFIKTHFYPDLPKMRNEYKCGYTDYFPFRFFNTDTNFGSEQFHQPSSSYYNYVEAVEVQNRVIEMLDHWPPDFVEKDALGNPKPPQSEIAVIAASDAQVMLIQQKMREVEATRNVPVFQIGWIQGLEFRVIFISTVRTLENAPEDEAELAFLTDRRLLNTAITRAKSAVAIVGSERTLMNVGQCRDIWRALVSDCRDQRTYFEALSMAREGMPEQANRVAARRLLQSRFEKVTVVPDYAEQRLMMSSVHLRNGTADGPGQSNDSPKRREPQGVAVSEPENAEMKRRFPKFAEICEKLFGQPSEVAIPWLRSTDCRMVWIRRVLTETQYQGYAHYTNLINRDEAAVTADLIKQLVAKSTGEILVVCATAAQASLLGKLLSSVPKDRFTTIDISHPLPRSKFSHLVMSLVRTNIKSERLLQETRVAEDRTGLAKNFLSNELINMELIPTIFELASTGGVAFVGNHLNASAFPAWDWLYRRIANQGAVFDNVEDLGI